jgi:hypothetical protein
LCSFSRLAPLAVKYACPTPALGARCRSTAGTPTLDCDHVHECLNFRGGKFSKSRGAAVDVPYYLSKYDPDPLRYYLTTTAPETRDTEFFWEDFVERSNNELVATWGNLANRHAVVRLQALRWARARAGRTRRRGPCAAGKGRGRRARWPWLARPTATWTARRPGSRSRRTRPLRRRRCTSCCAL